MSEQIIDIVIKLLAIILVAYVLPELKKWLAIKIGDEKATKLAEYIEKFVKAAEQMYKDSDATGEMRKEYVMEQLRRLGYVITDEINARIESEVFEINLFNEPEVYEVDE